MLENRNLTWSEVESCLVVVSILLLSGAPAWLTGSVAVASGGGLEGSGSGFAASSMGGSGGERGSAGGSTLLCAWNSPSMAAAACCTYEMSTLS